MAHAQIQTCFGKLDVEFRFIRGARHNGVDDPGYPAEVEVTEAYRMKPAVEAKMVMGGTIPERGPYTRLDCPEWQHREIEDEYYDELCDQAINDWTYQEAAE